MEEAVDEFQTFCSFALFALFSNYTGIKDIRNRFRLKNKLKQLKIEYLQVLRMFLSMKKKKKIIINQ